MDGATMTKPRSGPHFWMARCPMRRPTAPFVLLGDANLDPADGDGRRQAITRLLTDPRLQDPAPASKGATAAATQGPPNDTHQGDPALDTADWDEARGIGNMRVDYVLPSADLTVTGAGVWWPEPGTPEAATAQTASRHALVWVDLELP